MFEILRVTSFINVKVEHGFSQMTGVKTKLRNRLGCTKVDTYLRISEGVALADSDAAINISHNKNTSDKYNTTQIPKKQKTTK